MAFDLETWKRRRQRARTDLIYLCKVLGYVDVNPKVHGQLIANLQQFKGGVDRVEEKKVSGITGIALPSAKAIVEGYEPACDLWDLEGPRRRLNMIPRGHLKTTVCTFAHTIQWIINYPNVRLLLSTHTDGAAKQFINELRKHFTNSDDFRLLFPEHVPHGKGVNDFGNQEHFDTCARTLWRKEHTVQFVTVGSSIASVHFEVTKHDDIVDKENVRTPDQIQVVKDHLGMCGPLVETHAHPVRGEMDGWVDLTGTFYDFSDVNFSIYEHELSKEPEKRIWSLNVQSAAPNWPDGPYLWPERCGFKKLKSIEDDPAEGPGVLSCTPAGSPVLMADWSDKPIDKIVPGDVVIGFQKRDGVKIERGRKAMGAVQSIVKAVHRTRSLVQKMTMSSGRVVYCTPDHKWFTGRYKTVSEPHRKMYAPANVGSELTNVVPPLEPLSPENQRWMDWLGGMLDGEGSCHGRNSIFISQSNTQNPEVCAKIEECLDALGYHWTEFNRPAHRKFDRNHQPARQYMLRGGRQVMREILCYARMAKSQRIIDSLYERSRQFCQRDGITHKVVSIEIIGEADVYALETDTGNYVVWGYASSNSQYLMNPTPKGSGLIEDESQIVWTPRKVMNELYARLTLNVTVDLAGMDVNAKRTADNDFTVLNLSGFGTDGHLYVLELIHGKPTPHEVIEHMFDLYRRHPRIQSFKVPKDHFTRVLLPFLKAEEAKRGVWLPIMEISISNQTSKKQKIKGLQPWFQRGMIHWADDLPCKQWIRWEILKFPKFAHDDILDTTFDQMESRDGRITSDVLPSGRPELQPHAKVFEVAAPDGTKQLVRVEIPVQTITSAFLFGNRDDGGKVDDVTGW